VGQLTLCSWNLQLGRRLERVLETVDGWRGLDVIALQEVSERGGAADSSRVAETLGPDYDFHQAAVQQVRGRVQANALVWNRDRLLGGCVEGFWLPSMAVAGLPTWERRLLRRLREQARGSVFVEGVLDGDAVRVYSVHLDVFGFAHRVRQLQAVLEHACRASPAALTVVAGDLNTFGLSVLPGWRRLRQTAAEAGFEDVTADVRWTHRAGWVRQKLDAVLVHSRVSLRHRAWTLPTAASDHLPVFAELRW
jgi:endonuclease/exonuclease/phosphatase family metal-dependent hydrolase